MMYAYTDAPELKDGLDLIAQLHNAQARIRELEAEKEFLSSMLEGMASDYNQLKASAHAREVRDAQDICALVSEKLRLEHQLDAANWNATVGGKQPKRPGSRVFA